MNVAFALLNLTIMSMIMVYAPAWAFAVANAQSPRHPVLTLGLILPSSFTNIWRK
jgi:hypothetical protein